MPIRTLFPALAVQGKPYEATSSSGSDIAAAALLDFVGGRKPSESPPDPGGTSSGSSEIEADATWDPCDGASPSSWSVIDAKSFSSKGLLSSSAGPGTDNSDHAKDQEANCQAGILCEGSSGAEPCRGQGLAIGSSSGRDMLDRLAAVREDSMQPSVEKLPLFHLIPLQRRSFYYLLSNVMFVGMWVGCGIVLGQQQV
jgi:hypothetical protein